MRIRLGASLLALVATLVGVSAAVPQSAHASGSPTLFTIEDKADDYYLTSFINNVGTDSPSLAAGPDGPGTPAANQQWRRFDDGATCVHGICDEQFRFTPAADINYCLSQNNAGSAYLTPCTGNTYQEWTIHSVGTKTYLLDVGSNNDSNNKIWCLSSNNTHVRVKGIPQADVDVFTTGYTQDIHQFWAVLPIIS